jgi:DNA polymerase-3 subunit gamma/tau
MRGLIERISSQEGVEIEDTVYPLVIRAGAGSPRDTLSVLDQLLAGAETGAAGDRITYLRALALLGATDVALIDDAVDALAANDAAALFGAIEAVVDAGHDPRRFATDLLERFRDLIVLQAVPDAAARGVVDAPGDVLERMRDQAARIGAATVTRYAEVVHAGLGEMRGATAPRLLLEVVCARLLLPSASDSESALLQRVERIETRLDMSVPEGVPKPAPKTSGEPKPPRAPKASAEPTPPSAPKPEPEPAPKPEPGPPPPPPPVVAAAAGQLDAADVRRQWSTVRDRVSERSKAINAMLSDAIVRALDGDTLVLTHPAVTLVKRLSEQRNADVIREALKDALGVDWKVRCEVAAAVEDSQPADGASQAEEDSMLAEAERDEPADTPRRDPEEAALELLQNELGARRIDGS